MRARILGFFLSLAALPAHAQNWADATAGQSDRAFHRVESGGQSLMLGCYPGQPYLSFLLLGGRQALHPSLRNDPSIMVWIQLPDGRTGRYPLDTEYLGDAENALTGQLMLGTEGMQFFAAASSLWISAPDAGDFFKTGMSGSARAMQDFRATCGM